MSKKELILSFDNDRYEKYRKLLNSNKILSILENMPADLDKLEKVYYIYIELAKILEEDTYFAYNIHNNNRETYNEIMDERFVGLCRQINELFAVIIKDKRIGVDDVILTQQELNLDRMFHIDLIFKIDNKFYMSNLIRDLKSIKIDGKVKHFGESLVKRKEEAKRRLKLIHEQYQDNNITKKLDDFFNNAMHIEIDELISRDEELKEIFRHTDLLKIRDIQNELLYLQEIEKQIGNMTEIPMDGKDNNSEYNVKALNKRIHYFNRKFYTEDIIEMFCKKIKDSIVEDENNPNQRRVEGRVIHKFCEKKARQKNSEITTYQMKVNVNKPIDLDESIELKLDMIIDNIKKIIPKISKIDAVALYKDIFVKNKYELLESREQGKIKVYRILNNNEFNNFGVIIKVLKNDGQRFYYLQKSQKEQMRKTSEEKMLKYITEENVALTGIERNGERRNIINDIVEDILNLNIDDNSKKNRIRRILDYIRQNNKEFKFEVVEDISLGNLEDCVKRKQEIVRCEEKVKEIERI